MAFETQHCRSDVGVLVESSHVLWDEPFNVNEMFFLVRMWYPRPVI